MKLLLPCFFALGIISCTNAKQSEPNEDENTVKTDTSGYSQNDLGFIKKADSICQTIDAKSVFERTKNGTIVDRDGQKYSAQYKGYAKSSSDSIIKVLLNVMFTGKNSAKTVFYYYNGAIIKGITEIFADDTVKSAFYYEPDKMIYPNEPGMGEAAEKLRDQSISWRTSFPPNK